MNEQAEFAKRLYIFHLCFHERKYSYSKQAKTLKNENKDCYYYAVLVNDCLT